MMTNDTQTTCTVEIMTDDRETCVEKISMGHDSFVSKNGMDTEGFGEKVTVDERACHARAPVDLLLPSWRRIHKKQY